MDDDVFAMTTQQGGNGQTRYFMGGEQISGAEMRAMGRDAKIIALLEKIEKHLADIAAKAEK